MTAPVLGTTSTVMLRTETTPTQRARTALTGLAIGDGFGSRIFVGADQHTLAERVLPPGPWPWSDDTEMACSVYSELVRDGSVDPDALAASFAAHYNPDRAYGPAAGRLLRDIREGGDWRELAAAQFDGAGSLGNGAAMRVAPLGAWFADSTDHAARNAAVSAQVTHTHPDGIAGAVAVAVAAAVAARNEPTGAGAFLEETLEYVPAGSVCDGIANARSLLVVSDPHAVARELGCGSRITAADTVPFTLWVAAKHLDDYPGALWHTVAPGGDADTTCAIVGGIVATRVPGGHLPQEWRSHMEPLPSWVDIPPPR
ncbi:ADP-ribosylglycohydrolase [Haloactinospora alba]|uniref:ADP-ribosylglycohydrolase n=2 Tax=Haloactinospora alba TaxID=405555 RepID=A0A543NIW0_9ACTN|nr:ADP-ribosylglycohydrolase [Haloactinospora alba]